MLDLRTPIGWLFALVGGSLCVYGLTGDPAIYHASLGINVNLWWGLVMAIFGAGMLLGVRLSPSTRSGGAAAKPDASDDPHSRTV